MRSASLSSWKAQYSTSSRSCLLFKKLFPNIWPRPNHGQQCSEKYNYSLVSQFCQGKPAESVAHCSTCDHTHKDHWPRLLCMRANVFSGHQLVQIMEGPDKQSPDNRGCTVYSISSSSCYWQHWVNYVAPIGSSIGSHAGRCCGDGP